MPFLIGVAGGTASGKSTVCQKIMQQLGQYEVEQKKRRVATLSLDSFYKTLTQEEDIKARKSQYNFDHPMALDKELIEKTLCDIRNSRKIQIPEYDFKQNRAGDTFKTIYPADVVVVEGILTFYFEEIRAMFDMKLFVDTDSDTRLSRRVSRDVSEFGREIDAILYQYTTFVKPAFEEFCLPTKKYADVIIPRGADNTVAIELIVQHIQDLLKPSRSKPTLRRRTTSSESLVSRPHQKIYH